VNLTTSTDYPPCFVSDKILTRGGTGQIVRGTEPIHVGTEGPVRFHKDMAATSKHNSRRKTRARPGRDKSVLMPYPLGWVQRSITEPLADEPARSPAPTSLTCAPSQGRWEPVTRQRFHAQCINWSGAASSSGSCRPAPDSARTTAGKPDAIRSRRGAGS
jgi:hypothetical protein